MMVVHTGQRPSHSTEQSLEGKSGNMGTGGGEDTKHKHLLVPCYQYGAEWGVGNPINCEPTVYSSKLKIPVVLLGIPAKTHAR